MIMIADNGSSIDNDMIMIWKFLVIISVYQLIYHIIDMPTLIASSFALPPRIPFFSTLKERIIRNVV